jgi:hypothetical protein
MPRTASAHRPEDAERRAHDVDDREADLDVAEEPLLPWNE